MVLHPAQNVVEHADGFVDEWALVEHDAFCPLCHRGVCHFSARRQPGPARRPTRWRSLRAGMVLRVGLVADQLLFTWNSLSHGGFCARMVRRCLFCPCWQGNSYPFLPSRCQERRDWLLVTACLEPVPLKRRDCWIMRVTSAGGASRVPAPCRRGPQMCDAVVSDR